MALLTTTRAALSALAVLSFTALGAQPVWAKATALAPPEAPASSAPESSADQGLPPAAAAGVPLSLAATRLAAWAAAAGDTHGLPFAVVDKTQGQILVYDASGKLLGAGPALVGSAPGDDSAPGVGDLPLSKIPLDERTTPAGRFVAAYGPAAGEKHKVLWVDYPDAVSMHPVITSNPKERRPQRLASPTPDDNRISHGCINVGPALYRHVIRPAFRPSGGIVYVLPDTKPVAEVFPEFALWAQDTVLPPAAAAGFVDAALR
jgi:hypothetical protein